MNLSPTIPQGPGSVSGAPDLPDGFAGTFTSRYVDTGDLRLHAVTGGEGPPLLLVHGWPQNWYAWRMLMPALAGSFSVVAVDQRGTGLSGKPRGGYDSATLANDLVALMDALGHPRFAVCLPGLPRLLPPPWPRAGLDGRAFRAALTARRSRAPSRCPTARPRLTTATWTSPGDVGAGLTGPLALPARGLARRA
jgi:hypothetical protein